MKSKKLVALLCTAAMTVGMLAGCGSSSDTAATSTDSTASTTTEKTDDSAAATTTDDSAAASGDVMTLEFFDVAANYQGVQTGWFAKVVKDRFNIELNIIAPQVAGDAIYQTRASSGNLGDVLILESGQFKDCVEAGLVKDISGEIWNTENLKGYKDQIEMLNNGLEGSDGKIYGIPTEMMNTSPTSYSQDVIYSSPLLRWDLYSELGCPDIADLDGLLDVLEQMMKNHPTNEAGDPCYPFSLWPDWDGGDGMLGIANVVQLTTWYGEKIKGSVILTPDEKFVPLTDKSASYYKILKFLNTAQRRGLVDPDSATQDWNSACAKMSSGQVYLMWYSWQVGFWNSQDRLKNGTAFIFTPVADQKYYTDADTYYGSGRVWAVGSQVDDAKYAKIMEFLDWYASPEGLMFQHDGIEGFTYEKRDDGRLYQINDNALMDNLPVPEEWGGAGYQDGNNAINQWIVGANSTNPLTNETYAVTYWSTYKEATMTDMKKAWQERFDAEEPVDYMKKNDLLVISPNVSVSLPTDTSDIGVIRNQCNETVCDYSWRMIYAKDDAEFDAMWDEMTAQLDGFGFQDLTKFDIEKHTIELEAKKAVAK
ncbi:MAG: sugar ABC transporter substrate-binding protein [Lachnospiraceae bacterium]|nr:sugar ABC transporter substrate-binding protein [Lachnospiraceae bacterium]